ncbi:UNVERIFIED_CONTAM: hypothetical protein GTU68_048264, partial [Idotea baltica]|nr:hypothetical protein [Idotea baltica]
MHASSVNKESNTKVIVGVITGANGIKGYVRVKTFTDLPEDIFTFDQLYLEGGKEAKLKLISTKKDMLVVSLEGITDRNTAETMRNTQLYIMRTDLAPTDDNSYYHTDLIGLETRHTTGEKHGTVMDVKNFGSCDILEIQPNDSSSVI